MRKYLTTVIIACVAASFYQCTPSTDQKVAEAPNAIGRDISKEKQAVVKELRWLRDDINDRLDEILIKLETASGESKEDLQEAKLNLIDQRAKVEKSLRDASQPTDTNWDDIEQNARNTSDEVTADFEKLSGSIANALKDE